MDKKIFANKDNLNRKKGLIFLTDNLSAAEDIYFNIPTDNNINIEIYSLSKSISVSPNEEIPDITVRDIDSYIAPEITVNDINDTVADIEMLRYKAGAVESSITDTLKYDYNPTFLIAFDRNLQAKEYSHYFYQQLVKKEFKAEEVDLNGDHSSLHTYATTNSPGFKRDLEKAIENPENNFGKFLKFLNRPNIEPIPTGYATLDLQFKGGLREGLYVLGAGSGMGKTSFALQMADYIAQNGKNVMYFALEMSPEELISKSLSRICWSLDYGDDDERSLRLPTARQIQELQNGDVEENFQGAVLDRINAAFNVYDSFTSKMAIQRRALHRPTSTEIVQSVEDYILRTGKYPVVFVDYLQLLKPDNDRATDKEAVTTAINNLKILSLSYHIPVVVISSFNRSNYNKLNVDLDAFKESGDIEYTADVIMALENDYSLVTVPKVIDDDKLLSITLSKRILDPDAKGGINLQEAIKTKNIRWDEQMAAQYMRQLNDRPLKITVLKNRFGELRPYAGLIFKSAYSAFGIINYEGTKTKFNRINADEIELDNDWLSYLESNKRFTID